MSQFASIWRLRRRSAKNRLARLAPGSRKAALAVVSGFVIALLVAGHLAADLLMEPPIDLATPRGLAPEDLPAGAAALEAAFWLSVLLASVLNFRVLELLFRRPDIMAMQVLPIEPSALFLDRLFATWTEAAVAALATSIFFVPLFWHGGGAAAVASMAMLFGALIFGSTISLVVMLMATQRLIPPSEDEDGNRRPAVTDVYGGTGQILLYAPALALGSVVVLALFWKLLLGEPLRLGHFNDPFWIGSAIVVGTSLACLVVAYRVFVTDYFAMAPRFHEADAADYSAFIDYQTSSFDRPQRWEFGLSQDTAVIYRVLVLDDDRRMASARVGYAVVLLLAIAGLGLIEIDALPLWAAAMIPAILTALFANPWRRITKRLRSLDAELALPVAPDDLRVATDRAALREFLYIGVPYALAAALILGHFRDLAMGGVMTALLAISSGLFLTSCLSLARRFRAGEITLAWLPAALVAALGAVAIISITAAVASSVVVAAVLYLYLHFTRGRHDEK